MVGYIFGGNTGLSYDQLQQKRKLADALAAQVLGSTPKTTAEGIGAIMKGIGAGVGRYRANKGINEGSEQANSAYDSIFGKLMGGSGDPTQVGNGGQTIPNPTGSNISLAPSKPIDMSGNEIYSDFIGTVKEGYKLPDGNTLKLDNPYALAAVAATGKAESGYDPGNVNRSWSDPSESGKAGTAGGIMSWRGPRLASLQAYASGKGEQGNGSPKTQAEFLLQEDPSLIGKLNSAGSVQEAQQLMNNAWAFKGYNRPGGESARRMGLASSFLPTFQGQGGGQQVASLDPSAGMMPQQDAAAAIEAAAPGSGYVDPQVTTANRVPIPQQRPQQMPQPMASNLTVPQKGGRVVPSQQPLSDADFSARFGSDQTGSIPPQIDTQSALAPLPVTNIGPTPHVASVPPVSPQQPQAQPPQPQQVAQAGPLGGVDPGLLQLLSNPFLDEDKKAAVRLVVQQQMQAAENAQQEQTWRARQDYERQQQQNDPLRQAQIAEANARAKSLATPSRPITAEERQQWGIPDTDTRPYAMTAEGPRLVGGGGQTINIDTQVESRKAAAEKIGLKPDDPRYMGFLATGDLPKENQQTLTAIDKKAIQEADDMVAANQNALSALGQAEGLSDQANSGWFAGSRAALGNNLPDWMVPDVISSPESSAATTDMDNAIVGQALTQLKTVFGGNPTEGERSILLQLQGSSTMPANVRKQVFARARELAEKRLKFNQDRANELRGGTYYKPKDAAVPAAPNVDDLLKKYGGQ
ncbi:phage tail tip lysozyme [Rhizobium mongolense]|uniref:phage tail tip lysozyme n=1 Tax=Rhizobium mongolense TaxID=57676 RepID=UPI0034A1657B